MMSVPIMEAAALAGRLLLAALFLHEAFAKLTAYSAAVAYSEAFGVPGQLLPLAIVVEAGCGFLILAGFYTRAAALLLAAFCVAAGFIGHYGQGADDPTLAFLHRQMLMKDIAIAGGFLALSMAGAGAWSADGRGFGIGADVT